MTLSAYKILKRLLRYFFFKSWNLNKNCDNDLIKLIQYFPNKSWNWSSISQNPNITWEIIRDNPDKPWNWYCISCNPNITWEIIRDNPDRNWSWRGISFNKFKQNPVLKNRQLQLKQAKTRRILIHYPLESEYFLIPPDYSDKPVFKKGGPWCLEGLEKLKFSES